ncbi:MAG: hypothetical protein ACFFDT_32015, partial [Candidatus Hodarchaeota archaeon]
GSKVYRTAKSYFRSNLKSIIEKAQKAGAKVLVSNLVSNENGMEPFTWSFHEQTSEMDQNKWRQLYENGFSLETKKAYSKAITCYREAEKIDAFPAILHFRIGKCLEAMGEYAEARKAYICARDYDMLRFRASSEFSQIIRDVSQECNTAFINMDSVFVSHSEHGIIGNDLISEHLHPNFKGYFLMAKHMTQAITEHNLIEPVGTWRWDLEKSDAEYIALSAVTEFDEMLARYSLSLLTRGWPFRKPLTLDISKLSKDEKIILEMAKRIHRNPETWRIARHQLAEYFFNRNEYHRAKAEYRAISKLAPLWDDLAFVKLGDIALIEEDFDLAQMWYTSALQINGALAEVRAKLGILYLIQNNYERSRSLLEQSLWLVQQGIKFVNISELEARYFLSFCCLKLGDLSAARNQIEKVLKKQPNHSKALSLLSEINLN